MYALTPDRFAFALLRSLGRHCEGLRVEQVEALALPGMTGSAVGDAARGPGPSAVAARSPEAATVVYLLHHAALRGAVHMELAHSGSGVMLRLSSGVRSGRRSVTHPPAVPTAELAAAFGRRAATYVLAAVAPEPLPPGAPRRRPAPRQDETLL